MCYTSFKIGIKNQNVDWDLSAMFQKLISDVAIRVVASKGKRGLRLLEKSSENPMKENEALLKKIIKENKNTEYGKLHNFDSIRTVEDFQHNVPVSVYEDFAPYIERVKNGEKNLLTASKILGYSRTSGSSGVPKYIPATEASLKAYIKYTWTRALALGIEEMKKQGKRFRPGRGVFLSPATNECLPNGLPCSNIAEIVARQYGFFYPYLLAVPTKNLFDMHDGDYVYNIYRFALMDENITFFFSVFFSINVSQMAYLRDNWQIIVDDIEKGTISESVDMKPELRKKLSAVIRPMPERAAYLRKQFEQGFDETLFKRLWPNLAVICSIGNAAFKPAADYIRGFTKGIPFDFSIYGASEALIASCFKLNETDMQLVPDSCFYEFIPVGEPDSAALTLDKLEQGKQYEILITTQSGLYRYRIKDIIEVKGFRNRCPLIAFVYRKGQLFNIAGEKFSEEDARNTIEMFEKAHNIKVNHWLFYQDDSVMPNRYSLVVESDADIDWDGCIDELEDYMAQCDKRYGTQREKAFISRMIIQQQQPGTHDAWFKRCVSLGASTAQVKPVHSLDNDTKREFFMSRII